MKVKTWKAWHDPNDYPSCAIEVKTEGFPSPCRVVPEATWRKVMDVVKAADAEPWLTVRVERAMRALREHERKRK